ncbi:MAG: response regulator receiver [Bacteroidetes bacterium]|jgi:CheY-like chemotaxis protein|nr:response regulator receiver [Bacteroidota bacterium]MDF2452736.1 response regulator receiver [Bacteroidota bacterium]
MKRKDPKFKYHYAMLLDDNELDNFINQKTLEANYFSGKIYVNSSSKSALEFLNNIDKNIFPEIIFIDINMPMIDGFQFMKKFKTMFPEKFEETNIVILTSSLSEGDKTKSLEFSGKITFLNKPLTKDALMQL